MAPPVKTLSQYEIESTRLPNGCLIHPSVKARVVYQLRHGYINDASVAVCHTCDNTHCIEDSHHFLGSWKDNIRDATVKGRHSAFCNVWKAQQGLENLRNSEYSFHTEEGLSSLANSARIRFSGVSTLDRRVAIDTLLGVMYCLHSGMLQHQVMECMQVSQSLVNRTKRGKYTHRIEELRTWK